MKDPVAAAFAALLIMAGMALMIFALGYAIHG